MAPSSHVIIVGVTGEMGRRIASRMIALGYSVIGVARQRKPLLELRDALAPAGEFIPCVADISHDQSIESIAGLISLPVKAVIHAAGVPTAGGVLSAPTDALIQAMNIKVAGMVRLVRAVDKDLFPGSRIIGIGGHYGFEPTAYAATAGVANAALTNLIKQFSWAYGPRKVTAHLLAPGPADTPRLHRVAEAKAEREGVTQQDVLDGLKLESALGEFTDVDDVVWGVEMLLSPHAKALAGSVLFMDAGRRRGIP
jgi:NAD(P)-dependent dehydrogenase (short-subunit alcohol dehydrogenase family)